jgi:hypothetical protein
MLLFAILCGAMFTLSRMSLSYDFHFERRAVLEHATMSLAQGMAEELQFHTADWWSADPAAEGEGSLSIAAPPMKFAYRVVPLAERAGFVRLSVWGEYDGAARSDKNMAWSLSMDIASGDVRWVDIAFGSPDAHVLWPEN